MTRRKSEVNKWSDWRGEKAVWGCCVEIKTVGLVLMKSRAGNTSDGFENLLPPCSCGVMKSRRRQKTRWITHSTLIGSSAAPWKTQPVCQLAVDFLSGPAIDRCESVYWWAGGGRVMMETDAQEDGSIVSQLFELMRHYLLLISHVKVSLYKGTN